MPFPIGRHGRLRLNASRQPLIGLQPSRSVQSTTRKTWRSCWRPERRSTNGLPRSRATFDCGCSSMQATKKPEAGSSVSTQSTNGGIGRRPPGFRPVSVAIQPTVLRGWVTESVHLEGMSSSSSATCGAEDHDLDEHDQRLLAAGSAAARQLRRAHNTLNTLDAPRSQFELQSGEILDITPARAKTMLWELETPRIEEGATGLA